jgi:hypothetical protein
VKIPHVLGFSVNVNFVRTTKHCIFPSNLLLQKGMHVPSTVYLAWNGSPAHHSLSCHRRVWCPFLSLFFPFPLTPSNPKQRPDLSILGITRYHPNVITILRYLLSWMPLWASAVWGQLALGSLMHVASYFCLALRTLIYQDTAHITLSLPTVTFSLFGIISLFKIYF